MEDFVVEQNVEKFIVKRLDKADRYISQCKAHIVRHYDLIDKQKTRGHDARPAERALRDLMELHDYTLAIDVLLTTA